MWMFGCWQMVGQVVGDLYCVDVQMFVVFQVVVCIFDEDCVGELCVCGVQCLVQYCVIGFCVLCVVVVYVFDCDYVFEQLFDVQFVQYCMCIVFWCVGQDQFVVWQCGDDLCEVVFGLDYCGQVGKCVDYVQEIVWVDWVMVCEIEQCGVVVFGVVGVQVVGFGVFDLQCVDDVLCYCMVDFGKDCM